MEKLQISLAAARVNAGMTQDEVAERIHVAKSTIVSWENGKSMPTFAAVKTLSDLYQIPIDNISLPTKST